MAKFHFKYGAMNSGKSDVLIKTAYNYEERGLSVLATKPATDTKGDSLITARGGHERQTDFLIHPETNVRTEVTKRLVGNKVLHCVLIDEAQFLSPNHISQLFHIAKIDNISVIAYGLRADFRNQLFPGSKRLFEIVDNIEKLPTMCVCGSQAEFNTRKINGKPVFEGEQNVIDNQPEIDYDAYCGPCYIEAGGEI